MGYTLHFGQVSRFIPDLLAGAALSLGIALLAFAGGMVLGLGGAIGATHGGRATRMAVRAYVVAFTNTPQLVQIYALVFVLPDAGVLLSPLQAVLLGMTVNAGAYLTEIQRAGFASVRPGELDAATAAGLGRVQIIRHVVLPHVVRTLYPPLTNHYILMVLGTSMAAVFGVEELTGRAFSANAETFRAVEIFAITGGVYVLITLLATALFAWAARALRLR